MGVEYVVIAVGWNAAHQAPPVLMGQLFNYIGAPNRYGIPAFYELHVWAWRSNPSGVFADWNPRVSCDDFVGDMAMHGSDHEFDGMLVEAGRMAGMSNDMPAVRPPQIAAWSY